MSGRERTRQQLDPAGTTSIRGVTCAIVIGGYVYAVIVTIRSVREIDDAVLAVLSMALVGVATGLFIVETSAYRAPMSRGSHLLIVGLMLVAVYLIAAASWGHDAFVRDDWGAFLLGVVYLALGPYRPARELVVSGIAASIFLGFLVLVEVPWFVTQAPPFSFVIVGTIPVLAMCFASVAYSLEILRSLERWQRRASAASAGMLAELRGGIERSVQQDRVTILGRDVLPFFSNLIAQGSITDADRSRAREIALAIRNVMVAEADRSWLETVIEPGPPAEPGTAPSLVEDRDRLAQSMTTEQRTAVRALLVAIVETPGLERSGMRVRLTRDGELCRAVVEAPMTGDEVPIRQALAPYIAMMRSSFEGFYVNFDHPSLRLRFWYEQH